MIGCTVTGTGTATGLWGPGGWRVNAALGFGIILHEVVEKEKPYKQM